MDNLINRIFNIKKVKNHLLYTWRPPQLKNGCQDLVIMTLFWIEKMFWEYLDSNRCRIAAHFDLPSNIACCAVGRRTLLCFRLIKLENLPRSN